ncbi:hypothetical protein D3C76_1338170 [compost metagenome]
MATGTAVQGNPLQCLGIEPEPQGALGEPRFITQHETLGGLFGFRRVGAAVAVITVEVQGTHGKAGLAVFQKAARARLCGLCADRSTEQQDGGGNCSFEHAVLLKRVTSKYL